MGTFFYHLTLAFGVFTCGLVVVSAAVVTPGGAIVQRLTGAEAAAGPGEAARLHRQWAKVAERQCFPFSLHHSIARDDFDYPSSIDGSHRSARKGDLIELRCDSLVCPNPVVPDCYMDATVCGPDEWCRLEDQVRLGPWAMAPGGETPNVGLSVECEFYRRNGYEWIFQQVCRNVTHYGPWKPVRGRCEVYRQEQQSCNAYFGGVELPGGAPPPGHHHHHHHHHTRTGVVGERAGGGWEEEGEGEGAGGGGGSAAEGEEPARAQRRRVRSGGSARRRVLWLDDFHAAGSPGGEAAGANGAGPGRHRGSGAGGAGGSGAGGAGGDGGDGDGAAAPGDLWPQYVVGEEDGRPPGRPLLCGPGLACTGDVEPLSYTCVPIRPPNVCYQGPWWDSTWCKVGGSANQQHYAGLTLPALSEAAVALILQLPTERFGDPTHLEFWTSAAADTARAKVQAILAALWPEAYRRDTAFPLPFPDPRADGHNAPLSADWNATAAAALAVYRQASKVWSTVHTLIHNAHDPMPGAQVRASRTLAVWLRQHFMCCNCRGMWANYVLNRIGLPPESSERAAHQRWWWRAHNMVSEHAASTRGGHPWVWPSLPDEQFRAAYAQYDGAGGGGRLHCQNPWFLPYEFAELMWTIPAA